MICTHILAPCRFQRPDKEQKELASKWTEMGTDEPGKYTLRLILLMTRYLYSYSSKDGFTLLRPNCIIME